jgi:hypothetical protein
MSDGSGGRAETVRRARHAASQAHAGASRGRLTDAHDEVLHVIRKPEDRFARVV